MSLTDFAAIQTDLRKPSLALCLSGGGLRATFFHLGVIRFLRDTNLLNNVTQISSVSGGSIIAAHLVLNWQSYTGTDEQYAAVEKELLAFGSRDIRGRIVRRWLFSILLPVLRLFPKLAFRTRLLEKEYDTFFKKARLRDIDPERTDRPVLHILATSFKTRNLCSFSSEGFWIYHGRSVRKLYRSSTLPLALAVASSSAFPPLFPPAVISREMLNASVEELPYDSELLTDGGVFDNLGFAKFSNSFEDGNTPSPDYLILSDAGAQLDWNVNERFTRVISRTIRSTDILMQRVADITADSVMSGSARDKVFHLPITKFVLGSEFPRPLIDSFQKKIPRIRTDLNRFSPLEIRMLVEHGYEVAWALLRPLVGSNSPSLPDASAFTEIDNNYISTTARKLDQARTRALGLFDVRDWVSFALALYMCVLISVASFPYFYVAKKAAQGELFIPAFSDLDPSDATKIVSLREANYQDQPYSVVFLDNSGSSRNVREAPDALLHRYNIGADFAKLTAPNGKPVWVKGSAVVSVDADTARVFAPGVHSIVKLGFHSQGVEDVRSQGVIEDVPKAKSIINSNGGKLNP
jgi:predicted acylesterase/phospholipase RssA